MQAGLYTETAADPLDVTTQTEYAVREPMAPSRPDPSKDWFYPEGQPEPLPWRRALFVWGWCLLAGMMAGVWYVGLTNLSR